LLTGRYPDRGAAGGIQLDPIKRRQFDHRAVLELGCTTWAVTGLVRPQPLSVWLSAVRPGENESVPMDRRLEGGRGIHGFSQGSAVLLFDQGY
jgi:hypothetical protein